MESRSAFALYIDYYERKSSQKRVQSDVPAMVSFIQNEFQGCGSFIGYRAMQQRNIKNWVNVSLSVVSQIMKDLDHVGFDARRRTALRRHLHYGKVSTGYGILMVMISLSPLGFRSMEILMDTVDAYNRLNILMII